MLNNLLINIWITNNLLLNIRIYKKILDLLFFYHYQIKLFTRKYWISKKIWDLQENVIFILFLITIKKNYLQENVGFNMGFPKKDWIYFISWYNQINYLEENMKLPRKYLIYFISYHYQIKLFTKKILNFQENMGFSRNYWIYFISDHYQIKLFTRVNQKC